MTLTVNQAIEAAKLEGKTMHGWINANPHIIFEIYYPAYGIHIVFNKLPGAAIYELLTH